MRRECDGDAEARRQSGWRALGGWVYKAREIPLNPLRMSKALSEGDLNEVRAEIFAGRTITAIKLYRQYTGSGLKEAKDAVEEFERKLRLESPEKFLMDDAKGGGKQPEIKSAKNVPGVQAGKGCFGMVIGAVLLLTALVWIAVAFWH
jgi:ribosomal protein L7/L12